MGAVRTSSRKCSSITPQFGDRMMRAVAHLAAERAHRAAMGDDQDPAPEVRAGDALDRCVHPFPMLIARLAVRPAAVREPRLELGASEAGPGADVDLAQPGVADHRHAMRRRDDHRGLVGTREVARVDGVERATSRRRWKPSD